MCHLPLYMLSHVRLCNPMDCSPPSSSVHEDSPGKNAGLGCCFLLQEIFLTQRLSRVSRCQLYKLFPTIITISMSVTEQLADTLLGGLMAVPACCYFTYDKTGDRSFAQHFSKCRTKYIQLPVLPLGNQRLQASRTCSPWYMFWYKQWLSTSLSLKLFMWPCLTLEMK